MAKNAVSKGCLGGCAGLAVLLVVLGVAGHYAVKNLTPEQRAALDAKAGEERAASESHRAASADALLDHFRALAPSVPAAPDLKERLDAAFNGDGVSYYAMDEGFLRQFTAQGFVAAPGPYDQPWYRGALIRDAQGALLPNQYHAKQDDGALQALAREIGAAPFLVVIVPVEQRWPTLNADGKTFEPGLFRGWAVLVDGKAWTPLGQAEFTAENSEKVTSLRVGLGGRLVGPDLKDALENDFKDRFWSAVDAAVAHVCGRDGKPSFASHTESFPACGSELPAARRELPLAIRCPRGMVAVCFAPPARPGSLRWWS